MTDNGDIAGAAGRVDSAGETSVPAFTRGAECYEVLANAEKRLNYEGPFLLKCLQRAPGVRCLDMACGTGLHALFFAEHGARVDAVDLSPSMIEYARRHRPHESIAYRVGDMRSIEGGPWDLAVCLGNSFSFLLTESELLSTLTRIRERLSPGALLVAQLLNYDSAACRQPRHRVEQGQLGNASLVAVKNLVPHDIYTLLTLTYFIHPGDGPINSISESGVLRNWKCEQVRESGQRAGYAPPEFYGGFDGSPFDADTSPDVVTVLAAPARP